MPKLCIIILQMRWNWQHTPHPAKNNTLGGLMRMGTHYLAQSMSWYSLERS